MTSEIFSLVKIYRIRFSHQRNLIWFHSGKYFLPSIYCCLSIVPPENVGLWSDDKICFSLFCHRLYWSCKFLHACKSFSSRNGPYNRCIQWNHQHCGVVQACGLGEYTLMNLKQSFPFFSTIRSLSFFQDLFLLSKWISLLLSPGNASSQDDGQNYGHQFHSICRMSVSVHFF